MERRRFANEVAGLHGAVAVEAEHNDPAVLIGRPTTSAEHNGRIGAQLPYELWQFAMMPRYENCAVRRPLPDPPHQGANMSICDRLLNG